MDRTPLTDWHEERGARMIDFFGWRMPLQFSSITEEVVAVRGAVGLFDLCHMARIRIAGGGALKCADLLATVAVAEAEPGRILYGFVCNEEGGILDDITIYRDEREIALVVNAANRTKILNWIAKHKPDDVQIEDLTDRLAMIAVQGPRAEAILQSLTAFDLTEIRYFHFARGELGGVPMMFSRTGYTGEDGFELYVDMEDCRAVWQRILDAGADHGMQPIGLGARDTLRLEACMPLYGNEIDESTTPFEAGLGRFVHLDKPEFIGREALEKASQGPRPRRLACLEMDARAIPRSGYKVFAGADAVGEVTSGTYSPTLERGIAMAYVPPERANVDTTLEVEIRGKKQPARVVRRPFYRRDRIAKRPE